MKNTQPRLKSSLALKKSARRRQRGAVMVEGLVVIPFFILIFGGVMFAGNIYEEKLNNMAIARQLAWVDSQTCSQASDLLPPLAELESVGRQATPGTALCDQNFWRTDVGYSASSVNVQGDAVNFSSTVEAKVPRLYCNEKATSADFQAAVGFIWEAVSILMPDNPVVTVLSTWYDYAPAGPIDYYPLDGLYYYY